MKKIICILLCMLILLGCSSKKEEEPVNEDNVIVENTKEGTEEVNDSNKKTYDTYSLYSGVKSDGKSWYYDVPNLNEIDLGNAKTFANGDSWWLAFALDILEETNDLDEAYELGLEAYYSGVRDYFRPSENGFAPDKKEKVKILDFDMYKFEGYIDNIKNYEGPSTNCWIYGYSFIIGNTPCAVLGMTYEDNSDQAKKDIVMYVDDMVNSLRAQ